MNIKPCLWKNTWTDSGDRGAAQREHDRECHADHIHVWIWSPYAWEQGEGVQRCSTCMLDKRNVRECK